MYADLVSTPGFQLTFNQAGGLAKPFNLDVMGHGGLAAPLDHGHFLSVVGVTANIALDPAFILARPAPDQGTVEALNIVAGEKIGRASCRERG